MRETVKEKIVLGSCCRNDTNKCTKLGHNQSGFSSILGHELHDILWTGNY